MCWGVRWSARTDVEYINRLDRRVKGGKRTIREYRGVRCTGHGHLRRLGASRPRIELPLTVSEMSVDILEDVSCQVVECWQTNTTVCACIDVVRNVRHTCTGRT